MDGPPPDPDLAQATSPGSAQARTPSRVIAMINQKGGVGKTTTSVNLAAALARQGRPTLLIDLDPQAHASIHLGAEPSDEHDSVYDLLAEPESADPARLYHARDNLDVLPAETDLAAAETELTAAPDRNRRLRRALAALGGTHEFVIIDCPPSLGLLTINALATAREVVIPMQAHFLALQGVGKLLETVSLVRGTTEQPGLNPALRVTGVVLCMHDRQATHTQEVVEDLENFFAEARQQHDSPWKFARVLKPGIRRNIKLAECPSFGQTIFEYAPTAAGAEDYTALATNLIAEWDALLKRRAENGNNDQPKPEIVTASDRQTAPTPNHATDNGAGA